MGSSLMSSCIKGFWYGWTAKTKVKKATVHNLLFADDCTHNAPTKTMMQQSVDHFSTACDNSGFTISTKKTKVMHQPAPQKTYELPTITVKDETLEAVDKFPYLGSTLSRSVNVNTEVNSCIAKATTAFGWLCETVWVIYKTEGLQGCCTVFTTIYL